MLFVLFDHLEFFLVGSHYLSEPVPEQRLSIDSLGFCVLLVLEGLAVPLVVHVILLECVKLLQILVPLKLVLSLDLNDLVLEVLGPALLPVDQQQLLLGLGLVPLDLLFQRAQHLNIVLLLPPQHVDIVLELVIVGHRIVVGRNGLVQVGL